MRWRYEPLRHDRLKIIASGHYAYNTKPIVIPASQGAMLTVAAAIKRFYNNVLTFYPPPHPATLT